MNEFLSIIVNCCQILLVCVLVHYKYKEHIYNVHRKKLIHVLSQVHKEFSKEYGPKETPGKECKEYVKKMEGILYNSSIISGPGSAYIGIEAGRIEDFGKYLTGLIILIAKSKDRFLL